MKFWLFGFIVELFRLKSEFIVARTLKYILLQIKCISFVSLEIFIPYFFFVFNKDSGTVLERWCVFLGASWNECVYLMKCCFCWDSDGCTSFEIHSTNQIGERKKNTISYTKSVGCANFVENSVCISMWPCICVICFIIWVMYTYYFQWFCVVLSG